MVPQPTTQEHVDELARINNRLSSSNQRLASSIAAIQGPGQQ
jgi:hypothetical protein